jgi:hypothetical protein
MSRKIFPILLVAMLLLTACNLHIVLPFTQPVGATTTTNFNVLLSSALSQPAHLTLAFGAGQLKVHPGAASGDLVTATAVYNVSDFTPVVSINDTEIRVGQDNWHVNGIPDFSKVKNEWDLALADTPMALTVNGGAYKAEYEFGGLSLTNLTVSDGAAEVKMVFSSPNQAEMSLFSYSTGASNVSLTGLGNANFASLEFDSGAGNYTLDFSGQLKRNGSIHIGTGVSNLTLVIPSGVPAQITVEGAIANVAADSSWARSGNVYSQTGSGPQLTFVIELAAGNITLTR